MTDALHALSEGGANASLRRRREPGPDAPVLPETRALLGQPVAIPAGAAQVVLVAGLLTIAVVVYFQVVHNTKTHKPPPAQPDTQQPPEPDKDSKPEPTGEPTTEGPTPPLPPPPKPKPRCEVLYEDVINCDYIQQDKFLSRKEALEAVIRSLPRDRQKRPFSTRGTQQAARRKGADHTTYKSADGRTKITIGCYEECCRNTKDGPALESKMQCYEHNREYLR
jgi:hypothetical protein